MDFDDDHALCALRRRLPKDLHGAAVCDRSSAPQKAGATCNTAGRVVLGPKVREFERAEHQLQDGLLAESIRHDLHPPTFFAEQALDQIRRAGRRCRTSGRRD
jgi:hypothetical protein